MDHILIFISAIISVVLEIPSNQCPIQYWTIVISNIGVLPVFINFHSILHCAPEFQYLPFYLSPSPQ